MDFDSSLRCEPMPFCISRHLKNPWGVGGICPIAGYSLRGDAKDVVVTYEEIQGLIPQAVSNAAAGEKQAGSVQRAMDRCTAVVCAMNKGVEDEHYRGAVLTRSPASRSRRRA